MSKEDSDSSNNNLAATLQQRPPPDTSSQVNSSDTDTQSQSAEKSATFGVTLSSDSDVSTAASPTIHDPQWNVGPLAAAGVEVRRARLSIKNSHL